MGIRQSSMRMGEVMTECTRNHNNEKYEKLDDKDDELSDTMEIDESDGLSETTETIEIPELSEIDMLQRVCCFNNLIKPSYTMVNLRHCCVFGCQRDDHINFSQVTSYADFGTFTHPTAMWIFCPDHNWLTSETEAKYAISSLCSPISSYFGNTVKVQIDGNTEDMVLCMFRISKNKFPCEPIAVLGFKNLIIQVKLENVIDGIRATNKRELEDWEKKINSEYFKHVPPQLLNLFPIDLF